MRIDGKVWVVTGGGSGIGRELVLQVLERGGRVAAVDVSGEALAELADLAGPRGLSTHRVDITDRAAVATLVGDVLAAHGTVDGLVNDAGIIQPFVGFADLGYDDLERVLAVNLMGTVHMLKAFLPVLLERPEAQVVNVSSMGGFFPFPGQTVYGASKAAVKLLTEGLYAELLDTPVTVTLVLPGPVATDIAAHSGAATGVGGSARMPMLSAAEAARTMLAGVERDRLYVYLGTVARLSNLAIRVAPRPAILFVRAQMRKMMAGAVTPG